MIDQGGQVNVALAIENIVRNMIQAENPSLQHAALSTFIGVRRMATRVIHSINDASNTANWIITWIRETPGLARFNVCVKVDNTGGHPYIIFVATN